jgi:hypothetical protein
MRVVLECIIKIAQVCDNPKKPPVLRPEVNANLHGCMFRKTECSRNTDLTSYEV